MMRLLAALFLLVGLVPAQAAHHRHSHKVTHHRVAHHTTHHRVAHHRPSFIHETVHATHTTPTLHVTPSHATHTTPTLHVTPSHATAFHAIVAEFQAMGYSVGTPGCLSSGHMPNSKHHWGGACDLFNQVARNVTALRQPPPSVQIAVAEKHGLTSGCVWRHPDCGHFEVPSSKAMFYSRHHH